eukprot:g3756.t1
MNLYPRLMRIARASRSNNRFLKSSLSSPHASLQQVPTQLFHNTSGAFGDASTEKKKVSVQLLKKLRERTGAPMMDCKKALSDDEVNGDLDKALDWIRAKGRATFLKREGNVTSEGTVACSKLKGGNGSTLIELNCELDTVASSPPFQELSQQIADRLYDCTITDNSSIVASEEDSTPTSSPLLDLDNSKVLQVKLNESTDGVSIDDALSEMTTRTREKIVFGRGIVCQLPDSKVGAIGSYVHKQMGTGKIGVLCALTKADDGSSQEKADVPESTQAELDSVAFHLAMQIAAGKPLGIDRASLPVEDVEREKQIVMESLTDDQKKKPENILAKMIDGKMGKYYTEVALLEQEYLFADEDSEPQQKKKKKKKPQTVDGFLKQASKKVGFEVQLDAFTRFEIGKEKPTVCIK